MARWGRGERMDKVKLEAREPSRCDEAEHERSRTGANCGTQDALDQLRRRISPSLANRERPGSTWDDEREGTGLERARWGEGNCSLEGEMWLSQKEPAAATRRAIERPS